MEGLAGQEWKGERAERQRTDVDIGMVYEEEWNSLDSGNDSRLRADELGICPKGPPSRLS